MTGIESSESKQCTGLFDYWKNGFKSCECTNRHIDLMIEKFDNDEILVYQKPSYAGNAILFNYDGIEFESSIFSLKMTRFNNTSNALETIEFAIFNSPTFERLYAAAQHCYNRQLERLKNTK